MITEFSSDRLFLDGKIELLGEGELTVNEGYERD